MANNPKRQSLVGGGLERATLPFSGFQRAEPFGGYEVEKKSGESFLLGKLSFACSFRDEIDKGIFPSHNRSMLGFLGGFFTY